MRIRERRSNVHIHIGPPSSDNEVLSSFHQRERKNGSVAFQYLISSPPVTSKLVMELPDASSTL